MKNRQRVGKRQPAQEKQKKHQPEEDQEGAESEEDAEGEEDDDRDSEGVGLQILSAPLLAIQQPHASVWALAGHDGTSVSLLV